MASQYFYSRGAKEFGPFSATRLRELASLGEILPTDSVWQEGTAQRVPAAKVKNLFVGPATAPAPQDTAAPVAQEAAIPEPAPPPPAPAEPQAASTEAAQEEAPADGAPSDSSPHSHPASTDPGPATEAAEQDAPEQPAPEQKPRVADQTKPKKKRVINVKGAILFGQDGVNFQYRKKCEVCGHLNSSRSTMKIPKGWLRQTFFCPKCRKIRPVEIFGN
jgi:hypothetical protein